MRDDPVKEIEECIKSITLPGVFDRFNQLNRFLIDKSNIF